MNKRNGVAKLNRRASHRRAMMRNMATSLFEHERIVTTRARARALRAYSEKIITRARNAAALDAEKEASKILHAKRELMKDIKDRDVLKKLFEDLAARYKERPGGYTRIIHLPERKSDSSQMSIIELVDRKEKERRRRKDAAGAAATRDGGKSGEEGEDRQGKWYDRFRKKKKDVDYQ